MSDSVKKWHEMQEDKNPTTTTTTNVLTDEQKKEAYKILAYYDTEVILYATSIINNGTSL